MRTLIGFAFDGWRNLWFGVHLMVDDALDCWGPDDDD